MTMNRQIREAAYAAYNARGLTQKALAERVGMSQPAVGRILNGERKGDPDSWARILNELGLELVAVPKGTDLSELESEA